MAVVSAEGLVGRVIEAGPISSRVILLLDPQSRASILFQDSRDDGMAEGDGSPWLRVTHIHRESQVKVGERVLSSGLGQIYPKGIPVGTVEMVGTEKSGLELFATVKPYVNFSKLEEVLCITLSPSDS
jgi:rod shape-determining protein MreC